MVPEVFLIHPGISGMHIKDSRKLRKASFTPLQVMEIWQLKQKNVKREVKFLCGEV